MVSGQFRKLLKPRGSAGSTPVPSAMTDEEYDKVWDLALSFCPRSKFDEVCALCFEDACDELGIDPGEDRISIDPNLSLRSSIP